jgi:RNA polymerase sigma-70 factor (ECF subfamily)
MREKEQKRVFDEWMDNHKGVFFKITRAYAFNPYDRDDLFQEISIQVLNSIPKFRGDSSISTWIYRVALYSAMAWSRK